MNSLLSLFSPCTFERAEETRIIAAVGQEEYGHRCRTLIATNGRVLLCVEAWKHPEAKTPPFGWSIPAEWFWCFDMMRTGKGVTPSDPSDIERVPENLLESLAVVPGLQWLNIGPVGYWSHGRGKPKRKTRPAPDGLMFFAFDGGTGCAVASEKPVATRRRKVAA